MGKLEKEARSRRRNANIQRIVLGTIKAAGVLSVALLAPNALRMLELFEGGRTRKKDPKYVVQSTFGRLVQKGYITLDTYRGKKVARLTKKGRQALALFDAREYKLKKPRRWDKRWRVVIFDIPENRRGSRDLFRKTLRAAGFVPGPQKRLGGTARL